MNVFVQLEAKKISDRIYEVAVMVAKSLQELDIEVIN
jgi:hypothetical protein